MESIASCRWPIIAVGILVVLTAVRPGDGPFVNDEAILMEYAIRYNHTASDLYGVSLPFTPCPFGLGRGESARYGPLTVWTDQIFLIFTHDPITMLGARAFLSAAICAVALLWLCRSLGCSPWLAVLTMLSPWLWIYSRQLWDNDLCVPLSAMMLAAYADFLISKREWTLCLTVICAVAMLLIHFMSLGISVPIGIHLLCFGRREIWKFKRGILGIVIVAGFVSWPYWYYLTKYSNFNFSSGNSRWIGLMYPLLGGQELTLGIGKIMPGDGWQEGAPAILTAFVAAARWITLATLGVVWVGMALGLAGVRRALSGQGAAAIDHLCLIGWGVWIAQTALDVLARISFAPDYFNATWIVYVMFAWLAVKQIRGWLRRKAILNSVLIFHGALLSISTVIIAAAIARNGGTLTDEYGLSLSNQLDAVRRIRSFSDASPLQVDVGQWQRHPLALHVLEELTPPAPEPRPTKALVAEMQNAWPGDAHVVVKDSAK